MKEIRIATIIGGTHPERYEAALLDSGLAVIPSPKFPVFETYEPEELHKRVVKEKELTNMRIDACTDLFIIVAAEKDITDLPAEVKMHITTAQSKHKNIHYFVESV